MATVSVSFSNCASTAFFCLSILGPVGPVPADLDSTLKCLHLPVSGLREPELQLLLHLPSPVVHLGFHPIL